MSLINKLVHHFKNTNVYYFLVQFSCGVSIASLQTYIAIYQENVNIGYINIRTNLSSTKIFRLSLLLKCYSGAVFINPKANFIQITPLSI